MPLIFTSYIGSGVLAYFINMKRDMHNHFKQYKALEYTPTPDSIFYFLLGPFALLWIPMVSLFNWRKNRIFRNNKDLFIKEMKAKYYVGYNLTESDMEELWNNFLGFKNYTQQFDKLIQR